MVTGNIGVRLSKSAQVWKTEHSLVAVCPLESPAHRDLGPGKL